MLDNLPRGTICIEDIEIGMMRYLRKVVTDEDDTRWPSESPAPDPPGERPVGAQALVCTLLNIIL